MLSKKQLSDLENLKLAHKAITKEKVILICNECGNTFCVTPCLENSKYCSRKCYQKSREHNVVKYKCLYCGEEFADSPAHKDIRKCCSRDCFNNYTKLENWEERICKYCGKPFLKMKNKDSLFCSKKCSGKGHNNYDKHGSNNPNYKNGEKIKGELNPNWKGGISREPYGEIFDTKLKKSIRLRDSYTCQECHISESTFGYKLHVHHIDYNKKNNDPFNLISLCRSCHTKTNFNRANWQAYYSGRVQ